jgi:hypothetical protein
MLERSEEDFRNKTRQAGNLAGPHAIIVGGLKHHDVRMVQQGCGN